MADVDFADITPRIQYTAIAAQTDFTIPFGFFEGTDIVVFEDDNATPTDTGDYTIIGSGTPDGSQKVRFTVGRAAGVRVLIKRDIPIQRVTDFEDSGQWQGDNVNFEFDFLVATLQQVELVHERSMTLPETDPDGATLILPIKAIRSNKVAGYDSNGDPIASTGTMADLDLLIAGVIGSGGEVNTMSNSGTGVAAFEPKSVVDFPMRGHNGIPTGGVGVTLDAGNDNIDYDLDIGNMTNKSSPLDSDEIPIQATGGGTLNKVTIENVNKLTKKEYAIALSDTTTAITTGVLIDSFRIPLNFTLTEVRASLITASSSGIPTIDINEGGVSILSTKLTIDANEKTSKTASIAAVISDNTLADDAEISFDIDIAGTDAAGLKVTLIGHET